MKISWINCEVEYVQSSDSSHDSIIASVKTADQLTDSQFNRLNRLVDFYF
jgi:hypothetical protein